MRKESNSLVFTNDRIEFVNPDCMPKPIDEMERTFESQPRNPVIAKMFRLTHLSENLGYGLRKLKSWQEVTGLPMYIETSINSVKVTFDLQRRDISTADEGKNGAKTTARQSEIIDLIKENPTISLDEMAKKIGIGTTTLDREISKMKNLIQRVGPKKGGHFEIL